MTDANGILMGIVVMAVTAAAIVWWSPLGAENLSRYLLARAKALHEARMIYRQEFDRIWQPGARRAAERDTGAMETVEPVSTQGGARMRRFYLRWWPILWTVVGLALGLLIEWRVM